MNIKHETERRNGKMKRKDEKERGKRKDGNRKIIPKHVTVR